MWPHKKKRRDNGDSSAGKGPEFESQDPRRKVYLQSQHQGDKVDPWSSLVGWQSLTGKPHSPVRNTVKVEGSGK